MIGNDAFQEADIIGITRPITKHNYLVKDVKDLARTVKEAFHIASTGRPGPVLIDLPSDVQLAETEFHYPHEVQIRGYKPTYCGHPGQIRRAAKMIAESKRPVIYAGGGVILSGAAKELREFTEKINSPVTMTLLGLGAFPADHELSLGMLGMHGTGYANHAVQNCDMLIAIGARFDDRVTGKIDEFAPHAKIIHIDIDPSAISKSVAVDLPIVGDVKCVLSELLKIVHRPHDKEWTDKIVEWKEKHPLNYKRDDKLRPQYVIEQICEATKGDAIIATDVGQHQMWTAQWYKFMRPRELLSSGGLGTMGYGFPAGMGAKVGRPDSQVFVISGDGSFQMNIQELSTAVVNNIQVKIAILNNSYLGMVRQWQEFFYGKRYSHTKLENPDFVKIAEAYGAAGIRIEKKEEVRPAIEKAMHTKNVVVMDFRVEGEENVYPMVPAGKRLDDMIGSMA